jgi:hypothetical protein
VITTTAWGHNGIQVVPNHLAPAVAEDLFSSLVEKDDTVVLVYGDKRLIGAFNGTLEDGYFFLFIQVVIHFPVLTLPFRTGPLLALSA